ncbi:MAG: transposase [Planctomycetes bacterium]|nr:transposase [Planctomycetota bacterium]
MAHGVSRGFQCVRQGKPRQGRKNYIGGIVRELGRTAIAVGGTADHVHVLLRLPPSVSIADAMRVVKTNSSRWVHETSPNCRSFAWQTGYGAFSVSESNRQRVSDYIANQENHHRRTSFQEEYLAFLRRHGIDYDERFVFD